jgi:NAD(P)-dependent dehydrogenase (short-subunit alcohol dehydrogenase family)
MEAAEAIPYETHTEANRGSVVAITGAGGVIGSGIARRFAAAGASLVLHFRSNEGAVVQLAEELPVATVLVQSDISSPEGAHRVVEIALDAFGQLDVLVNNAGIQPLGDLESMSVDEWQDMIDTNLTGTHLVTQAAASSMISAGQGGSIIHIASIEGLQPAFRHGHYATSKAAVIMHARAAALEFGPEGIRVNSVSPGLIGHPGLETEWPEGIERWLAAAPLGRLGEPEEVGDACVFVASPGARWITGHNLVVDGGVSTHPTW